MDVNTENDFLGLERRAEAGGEFLGGAEDRSGNPKKSTIADATVDLHQNMDTYVSPKPRKRTFLAEQKIAICEEAAKIPNRQMGILLRKYGIYWSQLSTWRKKYKLDGRDGLTGNKKKKEKLAIKALEKENKRLQRENEKLIKKNNQLGMIIEVQKKISEILEIPQPDLTHFGEDE